MSFITCKYCESINTSIHGHRKSEATGEVINKRYKCHDCGRTFSFQDEAHNREAKVLVFDIETAPMTVFVWGLYKQRIAHTNIISDWFLLSWSAKWLFHPETMSDVLTPKEAKAKDDKRIAKSIYSLIDEADIVIAHNGKKFDMRKLNARFISHGWDPPSPYQVIDTLQHSRSNFAFSSHKQDYLTKFLDLPNKLDTDFDLWVRCFSGEAKALEEMVEYNRHDVGGLEELYLTLRPWMKAHPNMALYVESDKRACANCGSSNLTLMHRKYYYTPMGKYRVHRCGCGAIVRERLSGLSPAERSKLTASISR